MRPDHTVSTTERRRARRPRTAIAVVLACALAFAAVACGSDGSTDAGSPSTSSGGSTGTSVKGGDPLAPQPLPQRQTLKVAVGGVATEANSPLLLANHLGEFAEENLDVELIVLPPSDALLAFISGQVDMYAAGFNGAIFNAISGGAKDLKWIASVSTAPPTSGMGFWARNDVLGPDGKLDPCAVEGKTVSLGGATGYGGSGSWSMADFIAKCDLDLKDFNLSLLTGGDLVVAIEQGSVDMGFLADPWWVPLDESGAAQLAIPAYPDPLGGYLVNGIEEDDPAVVKAFLRTMLRMIRDHLQGDYKKDPAVAEAIALELDMPVETLTRTPSAVWDEGMTISTRPIDEMQAIWASVGGILNGDPIPSSQVVDMSYVEAVLNGE
jgi:NitT/TauT family transport system substrate-binding protein